MSASKIKLILLFAILFAVIYVVGGQAGWLPRSFPFNEEKSLNEWEEKIFIGRVLYSVKVAKADGYLSAYSKDSASGIFYRLVFDPKEEPFISWKWRVLKFPDKKEAEPPKSSWIEKDDYAARVYVIFPSIFFVMTKSLEYVWDKSLPEGTIMTSPYFKNIKIIVAHSGEKRAGDWCFEERNIVQDFKKAFGTKPKKVGAIAIMTDADNTLSTAEAQYDEIKVGYKK